MRKVKFCLYTIAILLVMIPIFIVLASDITFSSTFSTTVISTAILLIILAKVITIFEKRQISKSFAPDVGVIIGLFIVLVMRLI